MSKKYVGSGKKHQEYDIVNISIDLTKVKEEYPDAVFEYNNRKYIKLTISARREPDQYGKTHSVYIDDYKPEAEKPKEDDLAF